MRVQKDGEHVACESAGKAEKKCSGRLVAEGGRETKVRREGRKVHQNGDHGNRVFHRSGWRSHLRDSGQEHRTNVDPEE